jgi:hypothetical protein
MEITDSNKWAVFFRENPEAERPNDDEKRLGCPYCAGTGYEDYPRNKKPCRVKGHAMRQWSSGELRQ